MTQQRNAIRPLSFSDDHLSALLVENVVDHRVDGIVVNLSPKPIHVGARVQSPVRPWRSTILEDQTIVEADRIAVLKVQDLENLGGVQFRGWQWFGDQYGGFPRHTPLFVSSVDQVGTVLENPLAFTGQSSEQTVLREFEVALKCWWSPDNTDCFIHNEHPFLEVHTQIHGHGRMQKFRERDARTLYEETHMVPGFTHEAFCTCSQDGEWVYPWHRYYTDLESIWLAIELHPV